MTKRSAIMHIEGVPNPNAMKFVLENGILVDQPYEFVTFPETEHAPLARKLMLLRYVERVLFHRNYITVLKTSGQPEWKEVLADVRSLIQQHLEQNEPILYLGVEAIRHQRSDDIIVEMVKELLEKYVRPAAQEDGGDILFDSYAKGIVNLSMHGSCHGCPYVNQTLKQGVETMLTSAIPEVKQVIATGNNVMV